MPTLSEQYAHELQYILKNLDNRFPSMKDAEEKSQRISLLKSEVITHKDLICNNSKQLLLCLQHAERIIETDEKYLHMNRIFFKKRFEIIKMIFKSLVSTDHYGIGIEYKTILHDFFLSMKDLPIADIKTIS